MLAYSFGYSSVFLCLIWKDLSKIQLKPVIENIPEYFPPGGTDGPFWQLETGGKNGGGAGGHTRWQRHAPTTTTKHGAHMPTHNAAFSWMIGCVNKLVVTQPSLRIVAEFCRL